MKLKKIIENLDRMPSTLKGFNDTPKLSPEQKRRLKEMVGRYNELGQKLRMENSLIETASALLEITTLAETYACNEADEWFSREVIKQDFKRAKGITETFQKLAKECHGKVQQLNALYEDMGHILGRYYEISDPMQEVAPNPMDVKGQRGLPNALPQTIMQEVNPNDKNVKSQRQLPANGSISEVNHNDKNIKSQRNLPIGGPAPAQVKEVAVDKMNSNVKGQRNLPAGGPTSYHPPKNAGSVKENDEGPKNANVGTHGWENGRPWNYDHKSGKRVWSRNIKTGEIPPAPKSERDKSSGMTSYERNQLASHGMTSIDEVDHNESDLQSQRELPQEGPESYSYEKVQSPSVSVNPAGSGECNVKGERDVPQGGPNKDVAYESLQLGKILKTIE
jgi:hypothetical protein